jgi:predicted AAA+ superfamily ATPase
VCKYAGQSPSPKGITKEIGAVLQGVREASVQECIHFLAESLLIKEVMPLELMLRRQANPPKLCLCDHFVRDRWLQEVIPLDANELASLHPSKSTVAGHIVESTIGYYLAGIPGTDLAWFPERQDEPEVDYVVSVGTRRLPIEVKYKRGALNSADWRGLKSFLSEEAYNASLGIIITQVESGEVADGIIAVPAPAFMLVC